MPDDEKKSNELLSALAIALNGFKDGEIGLGARKRRGLGQCQVEKWTVYDYDLTNPEMLLAWIKKGNGVTGVDGKTVAWLTVSKDADKRHGFTLDANFEIDSSLLIRSGSGDADSPDMVHLRSKRNGIETPILSGTSLAGAMRARALKIAKTLKLSDAQSLWTIFWAD